MVEVLDWVRAHSRLVRDLADKEVLRPVMDAIASRLDGRPAALTVVNRKRALLYNALEYVVDLKLLAVNPIPSLRLSAPKKVSQEIDRRSVVNPVQARTLLNAIREIPRSGRRLYACFAASYFAPLRPEEAVNLRRHNITIPPSAQSAERETSVPLANEWGEFSLRTTAPHAGKEWTDSRLARDDRGLKHRPDGEERVVPIPPELTAILRAHLAEFEPDSEGRLSTGNEAVRSQLSPITGCGKGPVPTLSQLRCL